MDLDGRFFSMSLSFRIERPSGQSSRSGQASGSNGRYGGPGGRGERTLAGEYAADSSEDEAEEDRRRNHRELITDFDASRYVAGCFAAVLQSGLTLCCAACRPVEKPQELSIPALPDKDFRAIHLAKKRKKEMYRPEGGAVGVMRQSTGGTGAKVDESAEGVDQMNAKPMEGGLRLGDGGRRVKKEEDVEEGTLGVPSALDGVPGTGASTPIGQLSLLSGAPSPAASGSAAPPVPKKEEETEDQKALRELLAGEGKEEEAQIDMIPMASTKKEEDGDADDYDSDSDGPQDETSVFRRDVASRPDVPTLEDYARVPVGQFGAALLRGMGWQEGQAASRNGRQGPAEAYVPKARPSLLGIGAKPMKVDEEDAKKGAKRPERRYVPLVRKVTDRATPRDVGGH